LDDFSYGFNATANANIQSSVNNTIENQEQGWIGVVDMPRAEIRDDNPDHQAFKQDLEASGNINKV